MTTFDSKTENHLTNSPPETASVESTRPPVRAAESGRSDDIAGTSRMVKREERIIIDNYGCGESHALVVNRRGPARIVSTPLPKQDANPHGALTDYLNITFPFAKVGLSQFFELLFDSLGYEFGPATDRGRGLHGYEHSFSLGETNTLFAYGGQADTALLSLPGESCALISDWPAVVYLFRDKLKGHITRWDGAVDVLDGSPSVDDAVILYKTGKFNAGGRGPLCSNSGNWTDTDDERGRTFYVGSRRSGKMMRIYEKGKKEGDPSSLWVCWELELHNVDRIIPWEVLLEPGKYVAGAYPCMKWVQDDMCRVKTVKEANKISYQHQIRCAKNSYGKLINTMMEVEGNDAEKVIAQLRRPGTPFRLDPSQIPESDEN